METILSNTDIKIKKIESFNDIQNVLYINLKHRIDRKNHVEEQFKNIGFQNPQRVDAIPFPIGAIGCSISHLRCLEIAKENNWDHVLICEDDVYFIVPDLLIKQVNTFLKNHGEWDVLFLGGHNQQQYFSVDESCVQVHQCQCAFSYLVKSHYYDKLMQNMKEGIEMFIKEPENSSLYAIDRYWFRLQEVDNWYLIVPLSVTQLDDYSDIEKQYTNYHCYLLSLQT